MYAQMSRNQTIAPPTSVEKIVERIFPLQRITLIDQDLLMTALLSKQDLSETEKQLIGRVFDALQRGKLKVGPR